MKKLLLGLIAILALPLAAHAATLTATGSASQNSAFAYNFDTAVGGDVYYDFSWTQNGDGWTATMEFVGPSGCYAYADGSPLGPAGSAGYLHYVCPAVPAGTHGGYFAPWLGTVNDVSLTVTTPDSVAASKLITSKCNPKSKKC